MTGYRRWGLLSTSGILLGLGFPPFPVPYAAWFALVPILYLWTMRQSARAAFIDGYCAYLVTFAVAFQWPLFHSMPQTAWLSLPALLVIPMWMATPLGISVIFRKRLGRTAGLAAFAALHLLMEFGLRRGPLAFPWSLLGHSQASLFPINQLASVGGVPVLSLFVLLLNVIVLQLSEAFLHGREFLSGVGRRAAMIFPSVAAVAVVVVVSSRSMPDLTSAVRAGIVQPAVGAEQWADVLDVSRVDTLLKLTEQVPPGLDLVVWPETALPPHAGVRERLQRWTDSSGTPLLAGAVSVARGSRFYNAAHLFQPNRPLQTYRKERLVPFAERVPFQETWPWVERLAIPSGGVAGYAPGADNHLLEIPGTPIGVMICFESLFDDAARSYALRGAEAIVVVTQDGWWGDSFGYRQHAAFNRLRAIETGLPIVQASVSGVSGLITPDGRIRHRTGWMEKAAFTVDVPAREGRTLFVRLGDWVSMIAALGVLAVTAAHFLSKH